MDGGRRMTMCGQDQTFARHLLSVQKQAYDQPHHSERPTVRGHDSRSSTFKRAMERRNRNGTKGIRRRDLGAQTVSPRPVAASARDRELGRYEHLLGTKDGRGLPSPRARVDVCVRAPRCLRHNPGVRSTGRGTYRAGLGRALRRLLVWGFHQVRAVSVSLHRSAALELMATFGQNQTFAITPRLHECTSFIPRALYGGFLGRVCLGQIQTSQGSTNKLVLELLAMRSRAGTYAVRRYSRGGGTGGGHIGPGVQEVRETRHSHLLDCLRSPMDPASRYRSPLGSCVGWVQGPLCSAMNFGFGP